MLAPLDSTALVPSVADAKRAGIPTVIFDSGLADESVIVSYVATDNFHGGALAAREIGKRLGGKGNVILLRYNVGSESTEQREQGFLETLAKEFPEIKMLSDDQYSGTTPLEAQNKALELCNQFGDKLERLLRRLRAQHRGRAGRAGAGGAGRQGEVHRLRSRPATGAGAGRRARSTAWCCKIPWRWAT